MRTADFCKNYGMWTLIFFLIHETEYFLLKLVVHFGLVHNNDHHGDFPLEFVV